MLAFLWFTGGCGRVGGVEFERMLGRPLFSCVRSGIEENGDCAELLGVFYFRGGCGILSPWERGVRSGSLDPSLAALGVSKSSAMGAEAPAPAEEAATRRVKEDRKPPPF